MSLPPDEKSSHSRPQYDLRFSDRGDYLRVEVGGPGDSLEVSLAYWNDIAAECERRATRALLVLDLFENEPLQPWEVDQVIEAMRDSYMRQVRVAYCELNSAVVPQAEHGELTAREVGFTVRVFASEHEAELWLRYGEA
ncbi:MAG TPA: hypothetical protein VFK08_04560 [Rhodanobacteraceae bacterium]|jgi:hypothetical protein|nr:hypothetical protein [Rhodanobacteraceae bacterium]